MDLRGFHDLPIHRDAGTSSSLHYFTLHAALLALGPDSANFATVWHLYHDAIFGKVPLTRGLLVGNVAVCVLISLIHP